MISDVVTEVIQELQQGFRKSHEKNAMIGYSIILPSQLR